MQINDDKNKPRKNLELVAPTSFPLPSILFCPCREIFFNTLAASKASTLTNSFLFHALSIVPPTCTTAKPRNSSHAAVRHTGAVLPEKLGQTFDGSLHICFDHN